MDLEKLYFRVNEEIKKVDFNSLWEGFKPLKFALYNEHECFFDGKYIPKTNEFMANTSVEYNGEYIAIWNVMEEIPLEVLASKMVHEMFHGFQMINHETRFPDELKALEEYQYQDGNLSLKYEEALLLNELIESFSEDKLIKLLEIRKTRYQKYSVEYLYESAVEEIEGSANYVELMVLEKISKEAYEKKLLRMKKDILVKENYLPIRVLSYDIGAFLLLILKKNHYSFDESFNPVSFSVKLLEGIKEETNDYQLSFKKEIDKYFGKLNEEIKKAKENAPIKEGDFLLEGYNCYNAKYFNHYLFSEYFLMFKEEEKSQTLYGNFIIEIDGERVKKIYEIK